MNVWLTLRFCYCSISFFSSLYLRSQILGQLKVAGFIRPRGAGDIRDLNVNSSNWAVVKVFLDRISFPVICSNDCTSFFLIIMQLTFSVSCSYMYGYLCSAIATIYTQQKIFCANCW